jgi:hypothetical protein
MTFIRTTLHWLECVGLSPYMGSNTQHCEQQRNINLISTFILTERERGKNSTRVDTCSVTWSASTEIPAVLTRSLRFCSPGIHLLQIEKF